MAVPRSCRVLMVYPRFNADSFWKFTEACELVNARYPAAPLGLITVAALLPRHWEVRLVNRNTEELFASDIAWADMVMTGGMLNQQPDALEVIALAQAQGKPVVVGGPDATSSPHIYRAADFLVLGEAEGIIDEFIAAWNRGERSGTFVAPKFQIDVTKSPLPRFDLLKLNQYLYIGVQYSRGCPFTCEFCDIIELYGRVPRTKTTPQILAELEALYRLGYRGHVDFVDDNLIGNKKALKAFLPELRAWLEAHDYPFEFSTEASVNLADDAELLEMMRQANFFAVFVGIESPDPETLVAMRKKQNTRRDLVRSIHKIYAAGMFVTAGFIVGFDSEKVSVAEAMADFIEDAAIPVCMVGLLYALPNTQLTRRLEKEGRLHPHHDVMPAAEAGDQCTRGLNFDTLRPLREVLLDYRHILEAVFDPTAYAGRLDRLVGMLDRSGRNRELPEGDVRRNLASIDTVQKIINRMPEVRDVFWRSFMHCARNNPAALRYVVMLMAMYLHLGPFSRHVIAAIDRRIAEIDGGQMVRPAAAHPGQTIVTV
ncbi:MAG TPA: B12-binding domain-containing radical SAM protein [Xanthobacteraceae bacterium]|nr:B12-binding domain-containing radical SAM protein [Xanthobacteraceae bacterium]